MKVYRRKRRSCQMCKPNKTGREPRYKVRELADRRRAEREVRQWVHR